VKGSGCGAVASAIAVLAVSLLFSSARADSRADWAKCLNVKSMPSAERISVCTAALNSGTDSWAVSRAYQVRGEAHFDERDFKAAVADFSQFIHSYPSHAKGYYARAAAHFASGDYDLAVADYTRVIDINPRDSFDFVYYAYAYRAEVYAAKEDLDYSAADAGKAIEINPKLKFAYCIRGHAYVAKGDIEHAIADFNQAIEIDPEYLSAYSGRAAAYKLRGEFDLAIADDDQVVRVDPKNARAYFLRALTQWQRGSLSKSLADLDEAARLDPSNAYVVLWREILGKRIDQLSHLTEAAAHLDMKKWPAPVIDLYRDAMTPEQVLGAAEDSGPKNRRRRVCQANFYTAELVLLRGSKENAARLFELAALDCPKTMFETQAANFELKALRVNP
jgi:tetratricopeptide (TPR) repeat protein